MELPEPVSERIHRRVGRDVRKELLGSLECLLPPVIVFYGLRVRLDLLELWEANIHGGLLFRACGQASPGLFFLLLRFAQVRASLTHLPFLLPQVGDLGFEFFHPPLW